MRAQAGAAHANAVTRWFGPQFARLHPLLQELHRHGGTLQGIATIEQGRGLAGWVGRRLARRLGIPLDTPRVGLEVAIRHTPDSLHWSRRFGDDAAMLSVFQPVGAWPDGYWTEHTGPFHLRINVDVVEGGWHWRASRVKAAGLALPLAWFAGSRAYKRIEDGKYRFLVEFGMPLLGTVLRYGGALELRVAAAAPQNARI